MSAPGRSKFSLSLPLAGLVAVLIGIGLARFAYTPLIPALVAEAWLDPPAAAYLGAANLAGYLLGALTGGRLALWLGTARVVRAAMLAAGISFIACAEPLGLVWLTFWRTLAGVVGAVLMVVAAPAVLARTPAERRGAASGIVFSGVGLGIAASAFVVPALAPYGVATTWLVLGGASLILMSIVWAPWAETPRPHPVSGESDSRSHQDRTALTVIAAAYGADAVGFVPHTVFYADFLARELDRGLVFAGLAWGTLGVSAIIGPLIAGRVADRIGFHRGLVGAYVIKAAAVGLPALTTATSALLVSAAIVGALIPGMVSLTVGRVSELAPPNARTRLWGLMTTAFAAFQALAAYAFGAWFEASLTYRPLYVAAAAALLVAAIGLAVAGQRGAATPRPR